MIKIKPLIISHNNKEYMVFPRVELITDCISNKNIVYEVLCLVMDGAETTCPKKFFYALSSRETYMVYRHTLEQLRPQETVNVSINVNINFLQANYVEMLLSEFDGDTLVLELVENISLRSLIHIQERLASIKKNPKVRIWLDDFGTECSNFDVTNQLDFDGIKMSKELFWELYKYDKTLLKHMMKLLKRKSKNVIIEGVDSFDKYIFCKEQNCLMQGYFFNELENSAVSSY